MYHYATIIFFKNIVIFSFTGFTLAQTCVNKGWFLHAKFISILVQLCRLSEL